MPVVIQTRTYGPDLYAEVGYTDGQALQEKMTNNVSQMRGEKDFEGFE